MRIFEYGSRLYIFTQYRITLISRASHRNVTGLIGVARKTKVLCYGRTYRVCNKIPTLLLKSMNLAVEVRKGTRNVFVICRIVNCH